MTTTPPHASVSTAAEEEKDNCHNPINDNDLYERSLGTLKSVGQEFRPKRWEQPTENQWFYDEFSAIYRHTAPHHLNHAPSPALPPSLSTSLIELSSYQHQHQHHQLPLVPISQEQIYAWRNQAGHQPSLLLQLCITLMDAQPHLITSNLPLAQTAGREACRILKRLASSYSRGSSGSGGVITGSNSSKWVAAEAQFRLGTCYGSGQLGVPIDHERAFLWYMQASKQNHPEATYRTGVCYEFGIGTTNERKAFMFYRKAAHLAHPTAMYKLALIYLHGYYGQPVQLREAISWLQRAGTPAAMHVLAQIVLSDRWTEKEIDLIPDKKYAISLLHDAAKQGYAPSQVMLADGFYHGTWAELVDRDIGLAIYWYTSAARAHHPEGAIALAGLYLLGNHLIDQSDREAYLWARQAVHDATKRYRLYGSDRWTLAKACYMVGVLVDAGIGVVEDEEKEKTERWFEKAASLGHTIAAKRLQRSYNKSFSGNNNDVDSNSSSRNNSNHSFPVKEVHINIDKKKKCIIM